MSKIINIGNKDYTFEFTIEASLYNECTEKVSNLMFMLSEAGNEEDIKSLVKGLSDVPITALTMFYAGLLEHHGVVGDIDNSITSMNDAKVLAKKYMLEHKEDGKGNFYDLMNEMTEIMENDGFFSQIGLEQMMNMSQTETKKPQDHKKKTTKNTTKTTSK